MKAADWGSSTLKDPGVDLAAPILVWDVALAVRQGASCVHPRSRPVSGRRSGNSILPVSVRMNGFVTCVLAVWLSGDLCRAHSVSSRTMQSAIISSSCWPWGEQRKQGSLHWVLRTTFAVQVEEPHQRCLNIPHEEKRGGLRIATLNIN